MATRVVTFIIVILIQQCVWADPCRKTSYDARVQIENARVLAARVCEEKTQQCKNKFKDNPDIMPYIKTCDQPEPEYSVWEHTSQCLVLFPQPLVHSVKEMLKFLVTTKDRNVEVLNNAIKLCETNEDIRNFMVESTPLLKKTKHRPASETFCSYVVTEFREWARNQKIDSANASVNKKNEKKLNFDGSHSQLTYAEMMNKLLSGQTEKFECLSNYGKTYLSCWYVFSVIDPTFLAGLALKGPQLVKAFNLKGKVVDLIEEQKYPKRLQRKYFRHYDGSTYTNAVSARDYSRAWVLNTEMDLVKNESALRMAIKNGDPQIKFLEKIGFKFDFQKGHTVPSMAEIDKKISENIEALVKSGKIKDHQKLVPARMFIIEEGGRTKYIAVRLGEDPPPGAQPFNGTVRNDEFWEFVSKGYWPVGEVMRNAETRASFTFHDLGHFGSFMRHPDMMAAIAEFTQHRVATQSFDIPDNRVNFLFESSAVATKESVLSLTEDFRKLGISNPVDRKPENISFYREKLATASSSDIQSLIEKHYNRREQIVEEYGGLRNDVLSKTISEQEKHSRKYLSENPRGILERARMAEAPEEKRELFAKYLTSLDHSFRVSPPEVIRSLIKSDTIPKNSTMYQYACLSGAFSTGSRIFRDFCL